ncbi:MULTISPECIES: photosystem I protein PsaX [Nostoc]|jgi:photosystem I protein|uniref:Photosystem I protein PsaX n=1 Tax=Nostoc cf. edaphicum LEGE 07299 TaxID=2777974 RepID=A0ABR9TU18_9NOSO|nr:MULTISPECIES: photosystem I protein PsaX [Nostoc]MBE8967818.1 photosystem I protein PsaX [Nostocales cyanobacterium LEGE 12452]MBE9103901.1 photosystem I protein PsaX [Nostoc cf. edaphicum LEGE 07299]MDZ7976507.1 photosystem I protein PsaX [Nostoc sp. DedQUE03]MDZ8049087.1 photosystem I protein PsaX [Nostoc sp. DedQUE02]
MTSKTTKNPADLPVADSGAKPPYAYRTGWAIFLLAINFLVAAWYFHIIE